MLRMRVDEFNLSFHNGTIKLILNGKHKRTHHLPKYKSHSSHKNVVTRSNSHEIQNENKIPMETKKINQATSTYEGKQRLQNKRRIYKVGKLKEQSKFERAVGI